MAEKIYAKGIRCFKPHERAPEFVLGTMIIDVPAFLEWVRGDGEQYLSDYQGSPQLKLTVLQSDRTGVNVQVDTYQKSNNS